MTHLVRQQFVHLQVNGSEADGLAVQRNLSDWCHHGLKPAMERALDDCAPAAGSVCIDRLEIDAGAFSVDQWESELPGAVSRALERLLHEQIAAASQDSENAGNARHKSVARSIDEAFSHYLRLGRLPWSFSLPERTTLEEMILKSWGEGHSAAAGLRLEREGIPGLLTSAAVRKRLFSQFSLAFRETLLALLSPPGWQRLREILQVLQAAGDPLTGREPLERFLWETVLARLAAGDLPAPARLLGQAWRSWGGAGPDCERLRALVARHWPEALARGETLRANEHPRPGRNDAARRPSTESAPEPKELDGGIFIANAGLVLLHPFLPQFLTALGVVSEERMVQPERALCLLHFLATGQAQAPEHELVLPKLLCGLPLEDPVASDLPLSELELEEASALLEAVVRHWSALGNTSADGLRGTFLLRPGKLSLRDDGDWFLQVETRGFDILLDQLPWSISLIRLPWMSRTLAVEWV
jgi:hypothetical protein